MAHLSAERIVESESLLRQAGRGGGACCPRCGDPLPGADSPERELVWAEQLDRFGLSRGSAPLLEREERL